MTGVQTCALPILFYGPAPSEAIHRLTYASTLHVYLNGQPVRSLDISLTVWPFVLPDAAGPEMVVDLDQRALFHHQVTRDGMRYDSPRILADHPDRDVLEGTLASAMRLLHDHRLSPRLPKLYPLAKIEAAGHLAVDWDDYDRVVSGYLDGSSYVDRQPARSWQIPFDETFPKPPAYGAMSSPTYSRLVREYFQSAAEHFNAKGWLARSYVKVPYADRMSTKACEATCHFGYIAHNADPRLRVLSQLFPQDVTDSGRYEFRPCEHLADDVDIWAPKAQFFDRDAIARDFNSAAWMTLDRPPYSGSIAVCAPAVDTRMIAWQGKVAGVEAIRLGTANDWPTGDNADGSPQSCIDRSAQTLIYPGTPFGLVEPVPSLRLKRLRRGVQDVAYLELLRSRGREYVAKTLLDSLVSRPGASAYFVDGKQHPWVDRKSVV